MSVLIVLCCKRRRWVPSPSLQFTHRVSVTPHSDTHSVHTPHTLGCHAARAKTKKQVSGVSLLKNRCRKKCPRSPGPPASNAPKIVQGNIANTLISLLDEKKQQQILCFFYQNHQKRPRGVPLPSTLIIFYQNDPYDLITQGIIKEIMPKDHLLMKISLTAAITPNH